MAAFDDLIDDLASRFGLGVNARILVKEVLTMISTSPGGFSGFLDKLKSAGLTSEVASWLGRPDAAPIAAGQVERALGPTALSGIAGRLGLGPTVVSTALGYALPKIVGLLTPGGVVKAGAPAEVEELLSQPRPVAAAEQVAPKRIDVLPASAESQPSVARWLWPALTALVVIGLLSYFWSTFNRMPSAPPVAKAPEPAPAAVAQAPAPPPAPTPAAPAPAAQRAPAPAASTNAQATAPPASPPPTPAPSMDAQGTASPAPAAAPAPQPAAPAPPATSPATTEQARGAASSCSRREGRAGAPASAATPTRFALSNDNGVVRASGVVRDQGAKTSITDALNAVFGADKVKSDISVDPSAIAASWFGKFRAALETIKGANVDAIFQGDKISVGGASMDDAARDKVIAALKGVVGAGVTVGALSDKTAAAVAVANDRATTELASLQSGFGVKDLLFALE